MGFLLQGRQQHDTAAYITVRERQLSSRVVWCTFQQSKGRRSVINMSADEKDVDWQLESSLEGSAEQAGAAGLHARRAICLSGV